MTDDNDGPSGSRPTNEDILVALKGAEATAKHTREALTQNGRQTELIVTELHNLKQFVEENRAGLSEEAKKARLAPGKPCSCALCGLKHLV